MVHCVAVGCSSSSESGGKKETKDDSTVSFFQIPKEPTLRVVWLKNIKRKNLPSDTGKNITLCHLHFENDCFQVT